MARTRSDLLTEIQSGALDPSSDLPTLLRKCMALGGITGSESLRSWATLELRGYGPSDEPPPYREAAAPLELDGFIGHGRHKVTSQMVPANLIPDFARDKVTSNITFRQPIAEIQSMLTSARRRDRDVILLAPPGERELVALINSRLTENDTRIFDTEQAPSQIIERIYWSVSTISLARVLDVVRTTLVEIVAEMRAGTPAGQSSPSREIAEQAAQVAIHGNRNRVVINQAATPEGNAVAVSGGTVSTEDGAPPDNLRHRAMWWIASLATIVAAVAAVWALFL